MEVYSASHPVNTAIGTTSIRGGVGSRIDTVENAKNLLPFNLVAILTELCYF
jgi:hypothetical protein